MTTWGRYLLEGVRALALLAVAFLNFAHVPLATAADDAFASSVAIGSYCGDPLGGSDRGDHAPCHACRIGNAGDLPPDARLVEPVRICAVTLHVVVASPASVAAAALQPPARGPPRI